jgi:hypothetical protein
MIYSNIDDILDIINKKTILNTSTEGFTKGEIAIASPDMSDINVEYRKLLNNKLLEIIISNKANNLELIKNLNQYVDLFNEDVRNTNTHKIFDHVKSKAILISIDVMLTHLDHSREFTRSTSNNDVIGSTAYFIGNYKDIMVFLQPYADYNSKTIIEFNYEDISLTFLNNPTIVGENTTSYEFYYKFN